MPGCIWRLWQWLIPIWEIRLFTKWRQKGALKCPHWYPTRTLLEFLNHIFLNHIFYKYFIQSFPTLFEGFLTGWQMCWPMSSSGWIWRISTNSVSFLWGQTVPLRFRKLPKLQPILYKFERFFLKWISSGTGKLLYHVLICISYLIS